jgi:hypothetical protein
MRTSSLAIGTLLLGAFVMLVNCGGDDSSPTSGGTTGGSGGSGATGGSSGGTGGTSGGSAGTGGSSGAGMDGGTTGGSAGSSGAAGSGGRAGSSGAAGAAGSGGKGGASGAAGGSGAAGKAGSAGAGMVDAGADTTTICPGMQPLQNQECNNTVDCFYGPVTCTCVDPPMGSWTCSGGPPPDAGGSETSGLCPATRPDPGDACSDAGFLGPCIYESGHVQCMCDPASGWGCVMH